MKFKITKDEGSDFWRVRNDILGTVAMCNSEEAAIIVQSALNFRNDVRELLGNA